MDPTESLLAWVDGSTFRIKPLGTTESASAPAVSLEHDRNLTMAVFDDDGQQLATSDTAGRISVWSLDHDPPQLTRTYDGSRRQDPRSLRFDASGKMLGSHGAYLDDLNAPPDVEWQPLRRAQGAIEGEHGEFGIGVAFHPESTWIATGHNHSVSLWPLARSYPRMILSREKPVGWVDFTPDGKRLVFAAAEGTIRISALSGRSVQRSTVLYKAKGSMDDPLQPAMAPDGSFVTFGTYNGSVWVVPLDGGPSRELTGFTDLVRFVTVDPGSRLVAGVGGYYVREQALVRVWDLESGETHILDVGDGIRLGYLEFTADGDLVVDSGSYVRRWSLQGSAPRIVEELDVSAPFLLWGQRAGGNEILFVRQEERQSRLVIHGFDEGTSRELNSHGDSVVWAKLDPTGQIVLSTDRKGVVRVGPVTGEEPHLLLGHDGLVEGAFSPDGRWIATCGDGTIRLWPMPDLSKPPLHTLPQEELIAKLKTQTNLRVVRDEESTTGWQLTVGPFPGWETVPTW